MSFENLGDFRGLPPTDKPECGVCWYVYQPAVGDPVWQIPPNTPFSALPNHWCCPQCDGPKSQFIALSPERDRGHWEQRGADFERATQKAAQVLADDPISNPRLTVELCGFRPWPPADSSADEAAAPTSISETFIVGGVITPTFINLVRLPMTPTSARVGETVRYRFPSGEYDFLSASLPVVGGFHTLSLFSPVHEFEDMAAARLACTAALEALLTPPPAAPAPLSPSRRTFLGG